MLIFAAAAFVSCGGTDDEGKDAPSFDRSSLAQVKRLTVTDDEGYTYTTNMEYDSKGRIVKAYDDEYLVTFTYSGNKVKVNENGNAIQTFTLNSDGYIVSMTDTDEDGYTQVLEAAYDNGYLVSSRTAYIDGDGEVDEEFAVEYTWTNGNLTKAVLEGTLGFEYSYDESIVLTPMTVDLTCILDIHPLPILGDFSGSVYTYGFLGRPSRNAVKSVRTIGDPYTGEYNYTLNLDGTVASIDAGGYALYTFSY